MWKVGGITVPGFNNITFTYTTNLNSTADVITITCEPQSQFIDITSKTIFTIRLYPGSTEFIHGQYEGIRSEFLIEDFPENKNIIDFFWQFQGLEPWEIMIVVVALVLILALTLTVFLFCAYKRGFTGFYSTSKELPNGMVYCKFILFVYYFLKLYQKKDKKMMKKSYVEETYDQTFGRFSCSLFSKKIS